MGLGHWWRRVAVLVGLALPALAGAAPIEGPTWRLDSLDGRDLPAEPAVTVRFVDGRVEAFTGCNRAAGGYSLEGESVEIGPLAGTLMACPEPAMEVEQGVRAALAGTLRFALVGDRLTLSSDSGATLVFRAEPPPSLAGVDWEVTGFNNGRQAVVSPLLGSTLTLRFEDGLVTGHAGCNRYRAIYTQDGDQLAVGAVTATRRQCPGEGVMAQERSFLAALESVAVWSLERGILDVHRADGERALTARARDDDARGGD